MERQTTAFPTIPDVASPGVRWTCTRCGNDDPRRVRPDLSRPSLDPRYALGWCDNCAPARRTVRGIAREAVALVQSELFDREAFVAAERVKAEQKLLTKFRRGYPLTKDEVAEVKAIIARVDGR